MNNIKVNSREREDSESIWTKKWEQTDIIKEIKTLFRDDIRAYVLKYLPRNGVHIEAGCGLGRFNFYLTKLGFEIIGLDNCKLSLNECYEWSRQKNIKSNFKFGDVRRTPFPDNYFSSYLSFGVIEHFEEGPLDALREAYRILRGGGIAIIFTPNKFNIKKIIENIITRIKSIFSNEKNEFYQYEFSKEELAKFIETAGFKVIKKKNISLKYSIFSLFKSVPNGLKLFRKFQKLFLKIITILEKTFLVIFGHGSLILALKPSNNYFCFICENQIENQKEIFKNYKLPICESCINTYSKKFLDQYASKIKINYSKLDLGFSSNNYKNLKAPIKKKCNFCGIEYFKNPIFGNYGFSISCCENCIRNPLKNLILSNSFLEYDWIE